MRVATLDRAVGVGTTALDDFPFDVTSMSDLWQDYIVTRKHQ